MDENWENTTKPSQIMREVLVIPKPGLGMLALFLGGLLVGGLIFWLGAGMGSPMLIIPAILLGIVCVFGLIGLFTVSPNEAKVLQLFGNYMGTVREPGLRWVNPFFTKRSISLRVRNFESERLKVNDLAGNPIEIAAVVVWRVVDYGRGALPRGQLRQLRPRPERVGPAQHGARAIPTTPTSRARSRCGATRPRSPSTSRPRSRSGSRRRASRWWRRRISHLAYAPEIAHAMLQRQQASAVIAARQKIVEGAVGMVEMALEMLSHQNIVELDNEKKAAMVSNLLVVLCSDRGTQPIVNMGKPA